MRRHKYRGGEPQADFNELSFKEQAQSITASINQLSVDIDAHLGRARQEGRDEQAILEKRLDQIERMLDRKRIPLQTPATGRAR